MRKISRERLKPSFPDFPSGRLEKLLFRPTSRSLRLSRCEKFLSLGEKRSSISTLCLQYNFFHASTLNETSHFSRRPSSEKQLSAPSLNDASDEKASAPPSGGAFSFVIVEEQTGVRLDHFLVQKLPEFSRSQLSASVSGGLVFVDGRQRKNSYRLKPGELVAGTAYRDDPLEITAEKVAFEVLHDDPSLLIISKPPNLAVHPGCGNPNLTLVNGLVYYCQMIGGVGDPARPGIVHRLDKDTSGVMVVAKNNHVHRRLSEIFKRREVHKHYHALLHGTLKEKEGRVVAPIGRHGVQRRKMAVRRSGGKYAASAWKVIEEFEGKYSLVEIAIETGRTHQIRVHMAYLGRPVAGDCVYGGVRRGAVFPRQMLHASRLAFIPPGHEKKMEFKAPLWPDFQRVLDEFRMNVKYRHLFCAMNIALTGGIAGGKSSVAECFGKICGCGIVDTDRMCRDFLQKNERGWRKLCGKWGGRYLDPAGEVDRAALRKAAFSDVRIRMELEHILHPLVREKISERIRTARTHTEIVLFEAPLLFEAGWEEDFDWVIAVFAEKRRVVQRLCRRDAISAQEAESIISLQMSPEKKVQLADSVIDNSGAWSSTCLQIFHLACLFSPSQRKRLSRINP